MGFEDDISKLAKKGLPQTAKLDQGTAMALIERLAQQEFPSSEAEVRASAEPRLWKKYGKELLESGVLDGNKTEEDLLELLKNKKIGTLSCLGAMFLRVKNAKNLRELYSDLPFINAFKAYFALSALKGETQELLLADLGLREWSAGYRIGRVAKEFAQLMREVDNINKKI